MPPSANASPHPTPRHRTIPNPTHPNPTHPTPPHPTPPRPTPPHPTPPTTTNHPHRDPHRDHNHPHSFRRQESAQGPDVPDRPQEGESDVPDVSWLFPDIFCVFRHGRVCSIGEMHDASHKLSIQQEIDQRQRYLKQENQMSQTDLQKKEDQMSQTTRQGPFLDACLLPSSALFGRPSVDPGSMFSETRNRFQSPRSCIPEPVFFFAQFWLIMFLTGLLRLGTKAGNRKFLSFWRQDVWR